MGVGKRPQVFVSAVKINRLISYVNTVEMSRAHIDRVRVTATSFLSFFAMSSIISPLGLVNQAMAEEFSVDVAVTTAYFSYLTTGVLLGTFASLFVYSLLSLRGLHVSVGIALLAALSGFSLAPKLWMLPGLFVATGICCGLLLAAAVIVLSKAYESANRARAMLLTDSFYSGAGVLAGYVAGTVIGRGGHWSMSYGLAMLASLLIVIIAMFARYPDPVAPSDTSAARSGRGEWPMAVFAVAGALFVYILSFIQIYTWMPVIASLKFAAAPEDAGSLVSRFFLGLFVGQLLTFAITFKVELRIVIAGLFMASIVTTVALLRVDSLYVAGVAMFALGLSSGGILKTVLSFGTQLVALPSTRMVSFLVLATAVGSSLGPAAGALVVRLWGIDTVMVTVSAGYAMASVLVFVAFALSPPGARSGSMVRRG